MTETFPALAAWRAALAFTYLELGRAADARREFAQLATREFANLRWNEVGAVTFCLLAEVCTQLGDTRRAARLYEILLPAAANFVVIGFASAFWGSIARFLGLLAEALGRPDDAARHFEFALLQDGRVGAQKFVAQTQHDYARLLLRREGPGDREMAEALLTDAVETATRLELRRLSDRLSGLQREYRAGSSTGSCLPER